MAARAEYTPQFGFLVRKLSHSVISSNTLFRGYMKEMTADLGEHGQELRVRQQRRLPDNGLIELEA